MGRTCMEAENSLNNDELYQAVRNTVLSEKVGCIVLLYMYNITFSYIITTSLSEELLTLIIHSECNETSGIRCFVSCQDCL